MKPATDSATHSVDCGRVALAGLLFAALPAAHAEMSVEALAMLGQNPDVNYPAFAAGDERVASVGDIRFNAFLSPAKPGHGIWGAGVLTQLPTHSNAELGNKNWGLGPTFVVQHMEKGDPWVYGALADNIGSLGSDKQGGSYNNGLMQPFVNDDIPAVFYLASAPILTVNSKADSGQQWTVSLVGGIGKISHLGKLPVKTQLSA